MQVKHPYDVRWLTLALKDMDSIAAYVASEDQEAATLLIEKLWQAGKTLSHSPNRARPGRVPGTRELVLTSLPYYLVFTVEDNAVQILRVLHTARKYPPYVI